MAEIKRFGSDIGIKQDKIDDYKKLHDDENPGVRKFLSRANITNFSIYIQQINDGKFYLFRYFEYTGDDYDSDMVLLADCKEIKAWLSLTDPMQESFPGDSTWTEMQEIYFNK